MPKNGGGLLPHITYRNYLKINQRPIKFLNENIKVNLYDFGLGYRFLYNTPKAQATRKNR